MTISINSSLLLSYYNSRAGVPQTSGSGSAGVSPPSSPPTLAGQATPWARQSTAAQVNSLVQSVMSGRRFVNPNGVNLSIPPTTPNYANTKNLFALYQGLTALQDLATQANATGVSPFQLKQLQTAFASGAQQVQAYLNSSPFNGFNVAQGSVAASDQTTAGVKVETDKYTTGVLWSGDPNTAVPAFSGPAQFNLTVTLPRGTQSTINFNLDDMGATPRSIANVVSYLNTQLEAAGVFTRFADVRTPGTSTTYQLNGKTVTNPPGPDQYSLQIVGNPLETLSFSAPTTAPAIYITQQAGAVPTTTSTGAALTGNTTAPSDVSQQLLKLTTDPTASTARVFADTLAAKVKAAIATAAAPDGSVYVLANVTGPTQAGQLDGSQAIVGSQDVALMKYDSAGNLVFTQTLGSTAVASGMGLAVSADGTQVAVVGQATGLLDANGQPTTTTSAPTGFVSVYDNKGGQVWSQTVNDWTGGQVNDVAFGADKSVYVAGSALLASGVSDGFLSGFSPTGRLNFNTYLGPTSTNNVTGIAVSGSSIVTAGVQGGDAVVQSYALQPSGAPTLSATRDLGPLDGGNVAGVAVNADGSIIVAGSTRNGALAAGTIGSAYTGGSEAFVASLAANLAPSGSDTLAYFAGPRDTNAKAVTVADGKAYITGQIVTTPVAGSGDTTAFDGYAAQIDPTTGLVTWSNQFSGADNQSAPDSIAVSSTGASALDKLGLPSGTISFVPSATLTTNSSLQVGESFSVKSNFNALAQTVTIAANDTLQTLAQKIVRASGFGATAQVVTVGGVQQLKISPASPGFQVTLQAGPTGKNALPALGLVEGLVASNATAKAKSASSANGAVATTSLKANYALGMASTLNLSTPSGVKNALAQIGGAITTVKQIYKDMITKPSTTGAGFHGPVPAYLTAEISNYQAALARLTSSR